MLGNTFKHDQKKICARWRKPKTYQNTSCGLERSGDMSFIKANSVKQTGDVIETVTSFAQRY